MRDQEYAQWELLIVPIDGVDSQSVATATAEAARDTRVRVASGPTDSNEVDALNSGVAQATAVFVAFLAVGDTLHPAALGDIASTLDANGAVDVVYTDEDRAPRPGDQRPPHQPAPGAIPWRDDLVFHKPDWSPARLRSQHYIGDLLALRRTLIEEVGCFRTGSDGAHFYDLLLRATEKARAVVHVPKVRYHRSASASADRFGADQPFPSEAVLTAAKRALREHAERVGIEADVVGGRAPGTIRLQRRIRDEPLISIIIPTRGSSAVIEGRFRTLVTGAVRSIVRHSTYENFEVLVVADTGMPSAVVEDLEKMLGDKLRIVPFDRPFNFSDKINVGALAARGDLFLLLNDDVEVISPGWIEALLGPIQDADVAMVGAMLYFADGSVQHAGHCYSDSIPDHAGWRDSHSDAGYFGALSVERECSGVTAACALVTREAFFDVGGFCMLLPNNYNDVDFCLKIRTTGRRILFTPYAELFHYESKTRVSQVAPWETDMLMRRWKHRTRHDPYWTRMVSAPAIRRSATTPVPPLAAVDASHHRD